MRPSQRDLPVCAMMGLLLGSVAASAQPAPSGPPFQTRVEELGRALQNDPRLKNMSEQERNDGRYSAGGDVGYPTPLHDLHKPRVLRLDDVGRCRAGVKASGPRGYGSRACGKAGCTRHVGRRCRF